MEVPNMKRKSREAHPHHGRKPFRGAKRGRFMSLKHKSPQNLIEKTESSSEMAVCGKSKFSRELTCSNVYNKLSENDVGITEYISEHKGFGGIIKQRFADFHVNEIDCDGNIVTLTSVNPPEPIVKVTKSKEEAEAYMKSVLPAEIVEKLKLLADTSGEDLEIEVTGMSKDDRRELHRAIHVIGANRVISNTKEKDGKKLIIISKHQKGARSNNRSAWPTERGDYVYFVVHKENMDTMETVNFIASKLRKKPNMIGYAGTKDRRGKTSQLMCVWRVEPNKLASISKGLRRVTLGNYTFKPKCLKLGDLRGNRFRIVLRNVSGTEEQIECAMNSLKEKGFLNYYGLQRFGSCVSVPTYDIGRALLQGNWKLAIELILKPRDGEQCQEMVEARQVWWETRDPAKALKILRSKSNSVEGKLLLGLSEHGENDYINALGNIPRNTCLLYLHSYQSLLWNKVVSRRVQQFGLKPLVGDLVLLGDSKPEIDDEDFLIKEEITNCDENDSKKTAVRVLKEEDLPTTNISDIVLPLPGYDIAYPQNITKDWLEELLKADGLSSPSLKQTVRKYSLGGAYRKVVIQPTNLSWKTMHYSDPQTTLVLSDLEEMQKTEPPEDEPDGAYKALILDFCLPSSTYATMALREILKSDTSSYYQASLNDYHTFKKSDSLDTSQHLEESKHVPVVKKMKTEEGVEEAKETLEVTGEVKGKQSSEHLGSVENEAEMDDSKSEVAKRSKVFT